MRIHYLRDDATRRVNLPNIMEIYSSTCKTIRVMDSFLSRQVLYAITDISLGLLVCTYKLSKCQKSFAFEQ
jgi:hypothetical protein